MLLSVIIARRAQQDVRIQKLTRQEFLPKKKVGRFISLRLDKAGNGFVQCAKRKVEIFILVLFVESNVSVDSRYI